MFLPPNVDPGTVIKQSVKKIKFFHACFEYKLIAHSDFIYLKSCFEQIQNSLSVDLDIRSEHNLQFNFALN